jgi:hypothetical protein
VTYPLGLSKADHAAYIATLATSHEIRTTLNLLDMAGAVVGSAQVTGGQVLGDRRRFGVPHGPTKRLTLTAVDPHNALGIDSGDPGDGILYADRQVEVIYSVRVPAVGWVDVPVFLGTPTSWQRTGDEVQLLADDASALGMGAAWGPLTVPKGTKKVDAIERILTRRTGMTRFNFPKVGTRLHKPVSLHRQTRPWAVADRIASSMDMQLFRRSNGAVVLRRWPTAVAYTFDSEIVEEVATTDDLEGFANTVMVLGRNPKGPKKRVRAVAQAPKNHPMSAWRLGENGEPRRILHTIENDHIRSKVEAKRKAERALRDRLRSTSTVTVGVLPWPHLEPGDWLAAVCEEGRVEFRLDTYSLPLGVDGAEPMSLGFFLNAPVNRRRIRSKR